MEEKIMLAFETLSLKRVNSDSILLVFDFFNHIKHEMARYNMMICVIICLTIS